MKRHLALVALAITALFGMGCEDSSSTGRAIVDVSDINGGSPVSVSVAAATDENIGMTFRWRPYNNQLIEAVETTPHGDIVIEHYRITWTRDSAGSGVPPAREENTSIFVPVYKLISSDIRVLTAAEKADPSLAGGVTMTAHIDFNAREMGTKSDIIKFSTAFTVIFN